MSESNYENYSTSPCENLIALTPALDDFLANPILDSKCIYSKFQNVFDANCYLYLSRAMDWFDLAEHSQSTIDALSKTKIKKALVLGVETDTLFPITQQVLI